MTLTRPIAQPDASQTDSGPIARVVAASLLTGIVGALVLTLAVLPGGQEHQVIGSALVAFGVGWAVLAFFSTQLTSRPQRWAYVPAVVMSVTGLVLLTVAPGDAALAASGWVWPIVLGTLAAWIGVGIRRSRPGRATWMLYPVVVALAASAVGSLLSVGAGSSTDEYPMNGHLLHLDCTGSGSPTVVLENGLGLSSSAWALITEGVGTQTRVCAYDRAGQGWSEDPAQPQDGRAVAADLHALLAAAGEEGPIVLAGHSAGGAYAMTYAATYPDDVAGLVLLDSMSPRQFTLVPSYPLQYELIRRLYTVLGPLSRMGIGPLLADGPSDLPELAAAQLRAFQLSPHTYDNARDEVSLYRQTLDQAQALTSLGDRPLVVVTSTEQLEKAPGWSTAQDELARLSANSSHHVADTTHVGVLTSTTGSEISVQAITDVVRAVRTGDPLPQQ
jgi:pimeloyl-ACP methyl ester carboxylesterase